MEEQIESYMSLKLDAELKQRITEIAKEQSRSVAAQSRILLEMGVDEYERVQRDRDARA